MFYWYRPNGSPGPVTCLNSRAFWQLDFLFEIQITSHLAATTKGQIKNSRYLFVVETIYYQVFNKYSTVIKRASRVVFILFSRVLIVLLRTTSFINSTREPSSIQGVFLCHLCYKLINNKRTIVNPGRFPRSPYYTSEFYRPHHGPATAIIIISSSSMPAFHNYI